MSELTNAEKIRALVDGDQLKDYPYTKEALKIALQAEHMDAGYIDQQALDKRSPVSHALKFLQNTPDTMQLDISEADLTPPVLQHNSLGELARQAWCELTSRGGGPKF